MNGDQAPNALYLALLLMLVGSSLFGMRLPIGKALKMVLAWVAIFGVVFVIFAFRGEFSALGARLRAEAVGTPVQQGEELRIPVSADGHYWVEAEVNGHGGRFLVDSGASITTISRETADKGKVETGMRMSMVETANGVIPMRKATVETFRVGTIGRSDFTVFVNDGNGANVLGMNFLSTLGSWRVQGNHLVLTP